MISVIIPTYNEQESIVRVLECLRAARGEFEVLVADGASSDATCARAESIAKNFPHPMRVLACARPRARQLNQAARAARGDALLFLYADTRVPPDAIAALEVAAQNPCLVGGNFDLVFEGDSAWDGFFTWVNRQRRKLGIYYGDSAIWARREVFERMGGFHPLPIMDDYEFARRLEGQGKTASLVPPLGVSDRRWRVQGAWKTLLIWLWIHSLYSAGVPAQHLARFYKPIREPRNV